MLSGDGTDDGHGLECKDDLVVLLSLLLVNYVRSRAGLPRAPAGGSGGTHGRRRRLGTGPNDDDGDDDDDASRRRRTFVWTRCDSGMSLPREVESLVHQALRRFFKDDKLPKDEEDVKLQSSQTWSAQLTEASSAAAAVAAAAGGGAAEPCSSPTCCPERQTSAAMVAADTKSPGLFRRFRSSLRKARRKERECTAAQEQEHKLYLEEAVLERKIPETDLRQLVELPPGLGYEEWLASHTIDFFQHLNLLYGTVCEYCTSSGCPDMSGPATRQYLWFDEKGKKTRVAAPQYVDYVMIFTQKTINDESIFPTKFENDFPVSFESIVKKIHRLLFHVLAHLYHSHFREMVLLNLHSHLNCIFAHFILFNERFKLIDEKETEILQDLVVALKLHPESEVSSSTSSSLSATTTITSITTTTSTTTTASTGSKTGVMCSSSDDATVATSNQCLATEFSSCEEKCVVTQPCAGLSDSVTSSSSSNGGAPDTPLVGSGPPLITAGADDTQP
ncbi:uncharacterized protein LOC143026607 isoform X2 [Oratosquilla oratoria]|uniref:uncharacterized protein LOC143026607 isoform X2 n=1 Tax=Oratosquilla oratoria TaxID=337810 RepID=UPI003F775B82